MTCVCVVCLCVKNVVLLIACVYVHVWLCNTSASVYVAAPKLYWELPLGAQLQRVGVKIVLGVLFCFSSCFQI